MKYVRNVHNKLNPVFSNNPFIYFLFTTIGLQYITVVVVDYNINICNDTSKIILLYYMKYVRNVHCINIVQGNPVHYAKVWHHLCNECRTVSRPNQHPLTSQ